MVTTSLLLTAVVWPATAQEWNPAVRLGNLEQSSRGDNLFAGDELLPADPIASGPPRLASAPERGALSGPAAPRFPL